MWIKGGSALLYLQLEDLHWKPSMLKRMDTAPSSAWFDSTEGLESSFHCAPSPQNVFIDLRYVATGTSPPPRHGCFPQVKMQQNWHWHSELWNLYELVRILLLLANGGTEW